MLKIVKSNILDGRGIHVFKQLPWNGLLSRKTDLVPSHSEVLQEQDFLCLLAVEFLSVMLPRAALILVQCLTQLLTFSFNVFSSVLSRIVFFLVL